MVLKINISVCLFYCTDIYFKVAITDGQTFPRNSTILWGHVQENVGNGYDAASGRFVSPQAGTYHFTVTVMNINGSDQAYLSLFMKDTGLCSAVAAGEGDIFQTGVCSRVVRLAVGEEVWVINPYWSIAEAYNLYYTTFEGFMIHGDV